MRQADLRLVLFDIFSILISENRFILQNAVLRISVPVPVTGKTSIFEICP